VVVAALPYKNKEDQNACQRRWYTRHREQHQVLVSANKEKRRAFFRELKSGMVCEHCGETHPSCLEFHHRDPASKLFEIAGAVASTSMVKLRAEMQKCSILCANCHRKVHYEEKS
jgi:hypothetical protein